MNKRMVELELRKAKLEMKEIFLDALEASLAVEMEKIAREKAEGEVGEETRQTEEGGRVNGDERNNAREDETDAEQP